MLSKLYLFLILKYLCIEFGEVTLVFPNGKQIQIKGKAKQTPAITLRFSNWRAVRRMALNADLTLGEGYMDNDIQITNGSLEDLMVIVHSNIMGIRKNPQLIARVLTTINGLRHKWNALNTPFKSKKNVAHHYDISNDFFALFLDEDMNYSCAYYATAKQTLKKAQEHKKRRLINKLILSDGQSVLDIGSGWGGLALSIAQAANVRVDGVTLSENQLALSQERTQTTQTQGSVTFHLKDYRHVKTSYDRIVSVGMLEHIGTRYLSTYFSKVAQLLKPNGVAVIHSIGESTANKKFRWLPLRNTWIQKYIFPGGYLPYLPELTEAITDSGLCITDLEIMTLHYAETLKAWRQNVYRNKAKIEEMYDARFFRMWDFYLTGCEYYFRSGRGVVYQLQLTDKITSLPRTREYMNK